MKYKEFASIMTEPRMNRYLMACNGNTRKAMKLYRDNLKLSQQFFTLIGCFEVSLRNAIDSILKDKLSNDWLRDAVQKSGIFEPKEFYKLKNSINNALKKMRIYRHNKLMTELGFGFWSLMFSKDQYNATGKVLLKVFPAKPKSTKDIQYNNIYIFNKLSQLNKIRNRIAHHEPICFLSGEPVKDTTYIRQHYNLILQLFQWMQIDETGLLYGLDRINKVCKEIDDL